MQARTESNGSSMVELQMLGRRALFGMLGVVALLLLFRIITIQGWIRPVRVASGSMAECLWGPHWHVMCRECGMTFRVGTDVVAAEDGFVCPNCGAHIDLQNDRCAGCRVLIDRAVFWWRMPRAWEKIAFRRNDRKHWLTVKRVVAGPGTRVAIHQGDLFVDGQVLVKSLNQLRDVQILVYDDQYRLGAACDLPPRWRAATAGSGWRKTRLGYCHVDRTVPDPPRYDWLCYHQWTCWPRPAPLRSRTADNPILDNYGYNQDLARGPLHSVTDLMIACRIDIACGSSVALRLGGRRGIYLLELRPSAEECRILEHGRIIARCRYRLPPGPFLVEFAYCDRCLLAAINTQPIFQVPEPSGRAGCVSLTMPAIAAMGREVTVDHLRIYRDLYYLGPAGEDNWKAAAPVPAGNWFVLGDNVPFSQDSRFGKTIPQRQIIGSVIALRTLQQFRMGPAQ